jgi:hypothetical protein
MYGFCSFEASKMLNVDNCFCVGAFTQESSDGEIRKMNFDKACLYRNQRITSYTCQTQIIPHIAPLLHHSGVHSQQASLHHHYHYHLRPMIPQPFVIYIHQIRRHMPPYSHIQRRKCQALWQPGHLRKFHQSCSHKATHTTLY